MFRRWIFSIALMSAGAVAPAADSRPVVGPGATKDDVINAYGWPNGQSQSGTKEILNYAQGSVTLDRERVERVDFLPNVPWQTPKPRPGFAPPPAEPKVPTVAEDPWITSLEDAMARAAKQPARILAVFSGSDWSPPSKRFLEEVALHPDFVNPLLPDFVFLKVDFPTRVALPAELKKQNEQLRARCGVTTYPALVMLAANGDPLAAVDLSRGAGDGDYRGEVIAAVAETRELLNQNAAAALKAAVITTDLKSKSPSADATAVDSAMSRAGWNIMLGLGSGALIVVALLWWLWRGPKQTPEDAAASAGHVFSGLGLGHVPTVEELGKWPVASVRALAAGLFEEGGYKVSAREGSENEFTLAPSATTKSAVLVVCRSAVGGPATAKSVRALSGALIAEEIEQGWLVSPGGFYDEARAVAQERGIVLIDGAEIIARLKQLPALALRRVLARAEASRAET